MKLKIILFNLNLKVKEKTLQLHGWMKIQQEQLMDNQQNGQ